MDDKTVDLDKRRRPAAQKAAELRRLIRKVSDGREELLPSQGALEELMVSVPAADWPAGAEKIRYVLWLFTQAREAKDARRQQLIAGILADMDRLQPGAPDEPAPLAMPPTDGA